MALKTSRSGRLAKIIGIGASMVGKSISGAISARDQLEIRISQARALAKGLAELKGASMKLGQLLSLQGENFLPKEIIDVLSTLQNAAPAFSGEEIEKILVKELGDKFSDFKIFEKTALASASIGQVHKALLKNDEPCVIKVQYPGIASAIDSELDLLRKIITPFSKLYPAKIDLPQLMNEVKTLLKQEVDYKAEAHYAKIFRDKLQSDRRFAVPKIYENYSTHKILTMSFEPGLSLSEFLKLNTPQVTRDSFGTWVYELLLKEIFDFRLIQTDPNFANYLFRIDSDKNAKQVVLLDFGACKSYSREFIADYKSFGKAVIDGDKSFVFEMAHQLNFLNEKETSEVKDIFYQMIVVSMEPILTEALFDYGNSDLPKRISAMGYKFIKSIKCTPPPAQILFLNRKLGGIYNLLRVLGAKVSLRSLNEKYLS